MCAVVRESRRRTVDRYERMLGGLAGDERAEIAHVWKQAHRTNPTLGDFASRRLSELDGGGSVTVADDLDSLPDAAVDRLARYLRRVVALQSGDGLACVSTVAMLLREEQGRRVQAIVERGEPVRIPPS